MEQIKNLPEERRRVLQEGAGLTVVRNQPERNNRRMDTSQNSPTRTPSRAQQTLEHLAARLDAPPDFKEVLKHELKRATVWVPILLTSGVALLAVNKRFFLPKI